MKRILLIAVLLGTMITATTYFVCIAAPSVLFGGLSLWVYIILWLIVPKAPKRLTE